MEDLAHRYLALALRLERRQPGLLEAYLGPAELLEAVSGEDPTPVEELHDEALRIRADAEATPALTLSEERRSTWLAIQTSALATVARVTAGEEIALPDVVESLCDLTAERDPEPGLLGAHRLLDAALPPGPSLRARLAAHREASAVPLEGVPAAVERLAELLRERAHDDIGLAAGEALVFDPVHATGEGWHMRLAEATPLRTRLAINLAAPWSLEDVVRGVTSLAYPAGHAARAARQASAQEHERDELLVWCRPAPESTLADGVAVVGREVLLGDFELAGELRRIGRELGLRWDVERELEVGRARERLAPAIANAALLLHHDGLPKSEVRAYLAETALLEPRTVERTFARLEHPLGRVEPFARAQAPSLVRRWLEGVGQTEGLRRLMSDHLTPGVVRSEVGIAA